ncbi:MAG: response regulator [Thermodesulfobacteriota bacterium]|nr:response regulator [Thermodesulfobacteriota bacterium]
MGKTARKYFHVLVVDDDPMIRNVIGIILERHQIKSDFAANGFSALKKWKSVRYHAIMMDIDMPVMDGFEAVKEIRKEEKETNRPYTPVIAITSCVSTNDSMKTAGFDHYIRKPFTIPQFAEVINLFLKQPSP